MSYTESKGQFSRVLKYNQQLTYIRTFSWEMFPLLKKRSPKYNAGQVSSSENFQLCRITTVRPINKLLCRKLIHVVLYLIRPKSLDPMVSVEGLQIKAEYTIYVHVLNK